jgi:Cu(I)/Ag(I) efflux system membrane fusion protein
MMRTLISTVSTALLLAIALTAVPATAAENSEAEVLYWVAPMDPNYRRDKPGKSPMGMDLIPVYADESGGAGDVVSIDPVVVQNLGVRTARVERGNLWRRIETVGYVALDERKLSHVHLRTEGWIEKLYVKSDGERVSKGEVLFELYSRELVNAQEEYIQALRGKNDYLKRASRERLDALGMSRDQIQEVARSRRAAQHVRILATQDGIVHGLNAREGMFVKPMMKVMTLADLSSIWLLVDVFERQADWVATGQPAEVRLTYLPGRMWAGEVEFVYPTIDPKTRTLRTRLRFDNADEALKPDMYANVRIFAGPKHNVLSIPREALIRTGESERVILALGDGRFAAREVVAGIESGDSVEIVSGIQEGDEVVTSGQFLIDSEASLKASFSRMGSDDTAADSATAAE